MIIIDENFPDSQRQLLKTGRIAIRQIGFEVGRDGMKDDEIIPLLLQLPDPTLFTLDAGFFKPKLRHARYSLIFVDVQQYEAAAFIRRTLKHKAFDTKAKRLGTVIRVGHNGLTVWRLHQENKDLVEWE